MRLTQLLLMRHGRARRQLGREPGARLDLLRLLVTGLVRHERVQTTGARAREAATYADKLIDYAKRGDGDETAMKIADYWLTEKDLVPKLFKVLAPRFRSMEGGYVTVHQIPNRTNTDRARMAVMELAGNPYPPLVTRRRDSDSTLLNVLLRGYRLELAKEKAAATSSSSSTAATMATVTPSSS